MQNVRLVVNPSPTAQAAAAKVQAALVKLPTDLPSLVIAIGGDGTMLHAIREHIDQDAIFVGISAGHLGFLQTIDVKQVRLLVEALKQQTFSLIEAPLLAVAYCRPQNDNAQDDIKQKVLGYAFNDISVERHGARAAKFDLQIDTSSGSFIGDGVVFATPLGSTAYSLAAGGPIIDSKAQDLFITTPNNPHISTLYSSLQRPHILERQRRVRVTVNPKDSSERPSQLIIDGQVKVPVLKKPINIYLSERKVRLLQLEDDAFHNRIESKRLGKY